MTTRPVTRVVPATHQLEGGGFGVSRPFPTAALDLLDPFLLLDEMEPTVYQPGEAIGAPDHPHRGFETVTYVLAGEIEHRDSNGGHGLIGPGDVQWMTAGDGIVHSEMPSTRIQEEGGLLHGFQLWVNLPKSDKRATPRYQAITAHEVPVAAGPGWTARIIAGSMLGVDGSADTHTPVGVAHVTVEPGAQVRVPAPTGHNAGVYVFGGAGLIGEGDDTTDLPFRHLAAFAAGNAQDGVSSDELVISVPAAEQDALDVLVLLGEPLNEPVARYGPFVMNTREEIIEAIDDFNAGRMGAISPQGLSR